MFLANHLLAPLAMIATSFIKINHHIYDSANFEAIIVVTATTNHLSN